MSLYYDPKYEREERADTELLRQSEVFRTLIVKMPDSSAYELTITERTAEEPGRILVICGDDCFQMNFYPGYVTAVLVTENWDYRYFYTYDEHFQFVNVFKMFLNRNKSHAYMFGGTFNPVTVAHEAVAREVAKKEDSFVIIVPTCDDYLRGYKHLPEEDLVSEGIRYGVLTLATLLDPNILVEAMEITTRTSYTSTLRTLFRLKEKYRTENLRYIIGSDDVKTLNFWFEPEKILSDYGLCVAKRKEDFTDLEKEISESPLLSKTPNQYEFVNMEASYAGCSATALRKALKDGDLSKVRDFMTEEAFAALQLLGEESKDSILALFRKGTL